MKTTTQISPEQLGDEIAIAYHAEQTSGESGALIRLFHKHRGSPFITGTITHSVFSVLLADVCRLTARIKTLEAAAPTKTIEYTGIWSQSTTYAAGNACTHAGSLWIARTANVSRRPGSGDGCWTLAAKRGADSRPCQCKCAAGEKDPT